MLEFVKQPFAVVTTRNRLFTWSPRTLPPVQQLTRAACECSPFHIYIIHLSTCCLRTVYVFFVIKQDQLKTINVMRYTYHFVCSPLSLHFMTFDLLFYYASYM